MKCKVCGKNYEKHTLIDADRCMKAAFGCKVADALELVRQARITTSMSQPRPDKTYFEVTLNDGTVAKGYGIQLVFAEIALCRLYDPENPTVAQLEDDPRMDLPVADSPGLSLSDQYPLEQLGTEEPDSLEEGDQ